MRAFYLLVSLFHSQKVSLTDSLWFPFYHQRFSSWLCSTCTVHEQYSTYKIGPNNEKYGDLLIDRSDCHPRARDFPTFNFHNCICILGHCVDGDIHKQTIVTHTHLRKYLVLFTHHSRTSKQQYTIHGSASSNLGYKQNGLSSQATD